MKAKCVRLDKAYDKEDWVEVGVALWTVTIYHKVTLIKAAWYWHHRLVPQSGVQNES